VTRTLTVVQLLEELRDLVRAHPGAGRWEIAVDGGKITGLAYDLWPEHPILTLVRST
jgi:hypothetical protein